jgi:hypothetical protein
MTKKLHQTQQVITMLKNRKHYSGNKKSHNHPKALMNEAFINERS